MRVFALGLNRKGGFKNLRVLTLTTRASNIARQLKNGADISGRFDRRSEEILKNASRSRESVAQKFMDMDGDRFTHKELIENIESQVEQLLG